MEVLGGLTAYALTDKIGDKITTRFYKIKKINSSKDRLEKWGVVGVGIFAATPLPITFAVFYAGAAKLNKNHFVIALILGRSFKYFSYLFYIKILDIDPELIIDILFFWVK